MTSTQVDAQEEGWELLENLKNQSDGIKLILRGLDILESCGIDMIKLIEAFKKQEEATNELLIKITNWYENNIKY